MQEFKAKLKLKGKTVGYARAFEGLIAYRLLGSDMWTIPCPFQWDSIHPFVCKDRWQKNEIYEGDTVTGPIVSEDEFVQIRTGKVWYCDDEYEWMTGNGPLHDLSGVEILFEVSQKE